MQYNMDKKEHPLAAAVLTTMGGRQDKRTARSRLRAALLNIYVAVGGLIVICWVVWLCWDIFINWFQAFGAPTPIFWLRVSARLREEAKKRRSKGRKIRSVILRSGAMEISKAMREQLKQEGMDHESAKPIS